jgi:hypothetical protein
MKIEATITARWRQAQVQELPAFQSKLALAASRVAADPAELASCWLKSVGPEQRSARLSKLTGFTR